MKQKKQNVSRLRKGLQGTVAVLAAVTLIFGSSAAAYATEALVEPDVSVVEADAAAAEAEAEVERLAQEAAAKLAEEEAALLKAEADKQQAIADQAAQDLLDAASEVEVEVEIEVEAEVSVPDSVPVPDPVVADPVEEPAVVTPEVVAPVVSTPESETVASPEASVSVTPVVTETKQLEEDTSSDDVTPVVTTPAVDKSSDTVDKAIDDAVKPKKATTEDDSKVDDTKKGDEPTDSTKETKTDVNPDVTEGAIVDEPIVDEVPVVTTPGVEAPAVLVWPYTPMRIGNYVTIPAQEGVVYTDAAGVVLSGSMAVPRTHLTVTASPVDDGYVFPAAAQTVWVFKYETPIPPEGALIQLVCDPVPSAVINTYVTPYDIEWGPVLNVIYVNFEEVHRGYADDDGHFQYTLPLVPNQENFISTGYNIGGGDGLGYGPSVTFKPNPCDTDTPVTIVTPKAPTQVGNTVTIPADKCVVYKDEQGNVLTGTVAVPKGGLIVTASLASNECEFAAGNIRLKWPFEYKAPVDPTPEPLPVVTPESPISVDGKVTIPVTECVVYKDAAGKVLSGTISIPKGGLAITASPVEGKCQFPKDAVTKWNFEYVPPFTPTPKPTEPPVTPTPVAPKPTEAPVVPVPVPTETFKPSSTVSNGSTNKGDAKVKNDELAITGSESETSLLVAIGALALVASGFILMRRRRTQA